VDSGRADTANEFGQAREHFPRDFQYPEKLSRAYDTVLGGGTVEGEATYAAFQEKAKNVSQRILVERSIREAWG
jgi:hypothetical protein